MWSLLTERPFGNLSMRRITVFLLAIIVALLAATTTYTAPARAQTATDVDMMATWEGDDLEYNGWAVKKTGNGRNTPSLSGTVCENNDNTYSSDINRSSSEPDKSVIVVICLDEGAEIGDKSKAVPAQIILFRADEGTTSVSKFTPSTPTAISVAPLGTDSVGNKDPDSDEPATSCDSTYTHGMGWIICPITNFLASGMDWLYNVLSSFLVVRPVSTDQTTVLYRAWGFMRNLANVLFVVGFLIIIYSQITSFGLSSYGVKRLLPRLIVAAILVNVSYWITAVAVDLSNILGFAFQEMFVSMRNSLVGPAGNSWDIPTWQSVTTLILSGGAVIGGLGYLGFLAGAGLLGQAIFGLVPILIIAIMSILVAVLVMAARQAVITILIILSPLACVAYLLPNTEKYFERWRELFMNMLMVFPLFSIVFGGSQLAASAIIQNADNIITLILGMAVQVAPLAITPLLIKIGGSLLGRIAGIVNNPNRGLIDKTRNFTNERRNLSRARAMATNADGGAGFRRNNPGARLARRLENGKRNRAGRQKAYESLVEAGFENTEDAHQIHGLSALASDRKRLGTNEANYLYNTRKNSDLDLQTLEMNARAYELRAGNAAKETDKAWQDLRGGPTTRYIVPEHLATVALEHRLQQNANMEKALDSSITSAQYVQTRNFADAVQDDPELLELAGGIDPNGLTRARANAVSTITRSRAELVKNIEESSDVLPGDLTGLQDEFRAAVRANNSEAMRAYAETMTAAGNPGVTALRNIINATENEMSQDSMNYLKYFIDSNQTLNNSAEDIVTWSRRSQPLTDITTNAGTWAGLSPIQFVSQKQSSQMAALATGGISSTTAMRVLQSDAVRDLKPAVYDSLKITAGYPANWSPGDAVPPGWTP